MKSLANMQIKTNYVNIKDNKIPDGRFELNPAFTRNTGFDSDNNIYYTELVMKIKSTTEKPFPFDLEISVTLYLDLKNIDSKERERFLRLQGVQILFPYLRSMISNLTSSLLMVPLVLPVIDVLTLFPEDKELINQE